MDDHSRIVVVGGGIWGLSTAYHLAKMGAQNVRVLERNAETALETTPRAAGLVGQIRSSRTMCEAITYALDLLTRFEQETGHDPGLRRTGSLLVALTPERMQAYRHQVARANENGVEAVFVSHAEMARLAPAMDVNQLEGGYFVPGDGHLDPQQCARAYGAAAVDLGVRIDLNTEVTGLRVDGQQIAAVETTEETIPADHVVITAGPWTGLLARQTGFQLPMQPIRHQRVCTVPVEGIPEHHPVVRVTDVSCYVRRERGRYLYGYFDPQPTSIDLANMPSGFRTDDIPAPTQTMTEARDRLSGVFPILGELDVDERYQGMTTFAPDGQYLIGELPNAKGVYVASGCAALGIAGSAAVGQWLAGWVLTGEPDDSLVEFRLGRFGDRSSDDDWVREESEQFYGSYYAISDVD